MAHARQKSTLCAVGFFRALFGLEQLVFRQSAFCNVTNDSDKITGFVFLANILEGYLHRKIVTILASMNRFKPV